MMTAVRSAVTAAHICTVWRRDWSESESGERGRERGRRAQIWAGPDGQIGHLFAMSTIFSCFISNIVEIGFARPNADGGVVGRQIRWPAGRRHVLRMHIVIAAGERCILSVWRWEKKASCELIDHLLPADQSRRRLYCVFIANWFSAARSALYATNIEPPPPPPPPLLVVSIIGWRAILQLIDVCDLSRL